MSGYIVAFYKQTFSEVCIVCEEYWETYEDAANRVKWFNSRAVVINNTITIASYEGFIK